jgi:hypothetical protein
MILTSSYTRVQANSSESFLGWQHFIHELNLFLNKNVTKDTHGLTYVTLGNSAYWESPDKPLIQVFTGQEPPLDYDPMKLVSGTKYFLGEHGIKILKAHQEEDTWDAVISGLSKYERPETYQNIKNTWMKKELLSGTVIDVRQVGVEIEPGVFKLTHFVPETQYVDPEKEQFIYSIGKDRETGDILAAYDTRFYNDDDYETLYLQ